MIYWTYIIYVGLLYTDCYGKEPDISVDTFWEMSIAICTNHSSVSYRPKAIISEYLSHSFTCVQHLWRQCRIKQTTFHPPSIVDSQALCHYGEFILPSQVKKFLYRIYTYDVFQINLTFTKFYLKRSIAGCSFQRVWVSQMSNE